MIVCSRFPGDTNDRLMWMQHDLYVSLVGHIFTQARERYLWACRIVGVDTELRRAIVMIRSLDHRAVQDTHDTIAAAYRFTDAASAQLAFGDDPAEWEARQRREWPAFFDQAVARLINEPEITRAILTAVAHQNKEGVTGRRATLSPASAAIASNSARSSLSL